MVTAHAAGLSQAVVLRRQVREIAVQIQVLCVLPPACPPVVAGALKTQATPVQGSAHPTLTPSTGRPRGWAGLSQKPGLPFLSGFDDLGSTSSQAVLDLLSHLSGSSRPASLLSLQPQGLALAVPLPESPQ